jgi:sulfate transport system substrate-binding protein
MKPKPIAGIALALALSAAAAHSAPTQEILNASFDISRELFAAVNAAFIPYWKAKTGEEAVIRQSHAGSSKQALAIQEGLQADVVTFNQANDVEVLAKAGFVAEDWASRFPDQASPFYSVHAILVRKGNPLGIRDWDDLAKPGVKIVQVNPKTGGNGRYAVLAYYGYALKTFGGDEAQARDFLKKVLANVVIFESGGRAATSTFTERNIGDALVTFEAEVLQTASAGDWEPVTPSTSVRSEFPVAVVRKIASARGTEALAEGYLGFLYTPEGQEAIAKNHYRPRDAEVAKKYESTLKPVESFEIGKVFGSAAAAQARFFDKDALVDKLLAEVAAERP